MFNYSTWLAIQVCMHKVQRSIDLISWSVPKVKNRSMHRWQSFWQRFRFRESLWNKLLKLFNKSLPIAVQALRLLDSHIFSKNKFRIFNLNLFDIHWRFYLNRSEHESCKFNYPRSTKYGNSSTPNFFDNFRCKHDSIFHYSGIERSLTN